MPRNLPIPKTKDQKEENMSYKNTEELIYAWGILKSDQDTWEKKYDLYYRSTYYTEELTPAILYWCLPRDYKKDGTKIKVGVGGAEPEYEACVGVKFPNRTITYFIREDLHSKDSLVLKRKPKTK